MKHAKQRQQHDLEVVEMGNTCMVRCKHEDCFLLSNAKHRYKYDASGGSLCGCPIGKRASRSSPSHPTLHLPPPTPTPTSHPTTSHPTTSHLPPTSHLPSPLSPPLPTPPCRGRSRAPGLGSFYAAGSWLSGFVVFGIGFWECEGYGGFFLRELSLFLNEVHRCVSKSGFTVGLPGARGPQHTCMGNSNHKNQNARNKCKLPLTSKC